MSSTANINFVEVQDLLELTGQASNSLDPTRAMKYSQYFIMLPASFMQIERLWCNVATYVINLCVDRVLFSLIEIYLSQLKFH